MPITLYKVDTSPPARANMMLLELLKVPDVTLQDIDLFGLEHLKQYFLKFSVAGMIKALTETEFTKMNPQHTVPTLVDGDFVIWDSHAIAAYLVDSYAADDTLYPRDPKKRALVDQKLHFDSGILFPALIESIRDIGWAGATSLKPSGVEKINKGYDFLETFLADRTWLAGDNMTIADICCVATTSSNNEYVPVDPEKYPNITRWLNQFSKLDFYKKMNVPGCTALGNRVRSKIA